MRSTIKNSWLSLTRSNTGDTFCKVVSIQSRYSATTKVWSTLCPTKKLTRRQARWSLELSEYDFSITHRPGKLNGRADALSRQSDHHLENDCSNFKRILDPKQIIDLQSLISEMDLHVIVHSEVLQKVFVLESDWPLIIADFLAGEDNCLDGRHSRSHFGEVQEGA
ncbi:hypothetical protein BASA81_017395 [Batrachochytrium salamandrivorans]|nr:hypothetical protein BASA81_017395 [Batrachochytrium salamandrivorans]